MEILQLFSLIRRLYQPDVLPLARLLTPSSVQLLRERYAFAQVMTPTQAQLFAVNGELRQGNSKAPVPVQQLSIESNAIQLQVADETRAAELFYGDLADFLTGLSGHERHSFREYGESVQTIAIVTLDFPVESMFSKKVNTFVTETAAPAFRLDNAEVNVQLTHLQWTVSYTRTEPEFEYVPKLFTIEPRSGSRPEDRVYFTQSPTSSDVHRTLLEKLEGALKAKS